VFLLMLEKAYRILPIINEARQGSTCLHKKYLGFTVILDGLLILDSLLEDYAN